MHIFDSLEHAELLVTQWQWQYINARPNMAIGGVPHDLKRLKNHWIPLKGVPKKGVIQCDAIILSNTSSTPTALNAIRETLLITRNNN